MRSLPRALKEGTQPPARTGPGEISEQSPLEQARLLKLVQERIGGGVSMATLKEQIRAIQKTARSSSVTKRRPSGCPARCPDHAAPGSTRC